MARVVPTAPAAQSMGDRSDLFLFDPLGYARVTVLEPDGCQFKAVKAVRIRAVVAEQRARQIVALAARRRALVGAPHDGADQVVVLAPAALRRR